VLNKGANGIERTNAGTVLGITVPAAAIIKRLKRRALARASRARSPSRMKCAE